MFACFKTGAAFRRTPRSLLPNGLLHGRLSFRCSCSFPAPISIKAKPGVDGYLFGHIYNRIWGTFPLNRYSRIPVYLVGARLKI